MTSAPVSGSRLPTELLTMTFSCIPEIGWLLTAAHVCQQWRIVALEQPLFWREFRIIDLSGSALDFVEFRLKSHTRDIHFEVDFRQTHSNFVRRLLPVLAAVLPRVFCLRLKVESLYRAEIQEVLRAPAKNLLLFELGYFATGTHLPELLLNMALTPKLFGEQPNKLRTVWLENVILPFDSIPAFKDVTEVYWEHDKSTVQQEFPCYLFDFFPKMRTLRMRGGNVNFTNAPLPRRVVDYVKSLHSLTLDFWDSSMPALFTHLELHEMEVLTLGEPDQDAVYLALEPLRSHFRLFFTTFGPTEFLISVGCGQYPRIRHFVEPRSYYVSGAGDKANAILDNDEFALQLSSLTIHSSIWALVVPFLQPLTHLPELVVEIDEVRPGVTCMPLLPLRCPAVSTLVIQTRKRYVHLDAEDVAAFANRITDQTVDLQLRRVYLSGPREVFDERFASVVQSGDVGDLFSNMKIA